MFKLLSIITIVTGVLSSLFGLLDIWIISGKPWASSAQFRAYIFTEDPNRWYWQVGLTLILVGISLFRSKRGNKTKSS